MLMAQKEALLVAVSDYRGERGDLQGVKKDIVNMSRLFKASFMTSQK
jgi:hypothetical protein